MSQSNSSTDHFGWSVYKGATPEIREAFLKELDLEHSLPLVTWQGQVGMLDGAPDEIILQYLPLIYWRGQVELFNKHLSVGAMPQAISKLHKMAKRHLKIEEPKSKLLKRRWDY